MVRSRKPFGERLNIGMIRLIAAGVVLVPSCVAPEKAKIEAHNFRGLEDNWDRILITKIDGRSIKPPRETLSVPAGTRTITFSLSYMRGGLERPITVEVPVTATIVDGKSYTVYPNYKTAYMGVLIVERSDPPVITSGGMVYSSDFAAYDPRRK